MDRGEIVRGAGYVVELEVSLQINVTIFVIVVSLDDRRHSVIQSTACGPCRPSDKLSDLDLAHQASGLVFV